MKKVISNCCQTACVGAGIGAAIGGIRWWAKASAGSCGPHYECRNLFVIILAIGAVALPTFCCCLFDMGCNENSVKASRNNHHDDGRYLLQEVVVVSEDEVHSDNEEEEIVVPEDVNIEPAETQHPVHEEDRQEKTSETNGETEGEQLQNPGLTDHNSGGISTGIVAVEEVPDGSDCQICLNLMNDAVITPNGQSYCERCITQWINDHGTDPVSGNQLESNQLRPNYDLRKTIEWFRKHNNTGVSNPGTPSVQTEAVAEIRLASTTTTTSTTLPFWCQSTPSKQPSSPSTGTEPQESISPNLR